MTATIKGITVTGTPEEIAQLMKLVNPETITTTYPGIVWPNIYPQYPPIVYYGNGYSAPVTTLSEKQTKNFMKNLSKTSGNRSYK